MVNILVVEDERLIARLLKETLEIEGYQTVVVLNGEDAVQFALRETPDLILLDITLPGIDGYEVIRRLREHPKTIHIPIVVLSAYSSSTDKARAFELGVDGYITKPFNNDELLACVRRQLHRIQQSSLSPLTRLPGGLQLERAISYKLDSNNPWSVLYLDLDNFKAFNDVYGFLAGNAMILLVGDICQRMVHEYGNDDDFVGHVGGDDFIIVTTPDCVKTLCRFILAAYKQESIVLYRPEDVKCGLINGVDRKGRPYQFPLVSLSIGVVSNQLSYAYSIEAIGPLAAEAKRHAKQSIDNIFHISYQCSQVSTEQLCSPQTPSPRSSSAYFAFRHHHYAPPHMEENMLAEFK
jgi:diguanylate cyclase (GGDEF)-like protein